MVSTIKTRWRQLRGVVLVNLAVLIGLYCLVEIAFHIISFNSNPIPRLLSATNGLRIHNSVYTHTLKPKFDGFDNWGPFQYRMFTNSLGFRDASTRDVPLVTDRKRIVFMGDSFTEGMGVPYEQTFVGKFANAFPDIDVLDGGVSSYAPSVYYAKIKYFLDAGLQFDEAFVYIDISDIQDEAFAYSFDEYGVLQFVSEMCSLAPLPKKTWWEKAFYVVDSLNQTWQFKKLARLIEHANLRDLMQPPLIYSRESARGSWTYNSNAPCYGDIGVEGGIQKAKRQMDRLYEVLSAHGIALSVGVYPWPQQLLYESADSRQMKIWRDWCAGRCKQFFDHFPAFFRYKEQDPEFVKNLFIWGDVHYTVRGNQILADDLIEKYRQR